MRFLKWYIFRFLCTYFHWKVLRSQTYSFYNCWEYCDSFEDYLDDVEWKTLVSDAEYMVHEDFSYWNE